MALHLIVDGYNLLGAGRGGAGSDPDRLEDEREALVEDLRRYKRAKGFRITVVFDGPRDRPGQEGFQHKGIHVRFTGGGQSADDAIVGLVRGAPAGAVVVTSDRSVAAACERLGASVVSSQEFRERLAAAWLEEVKGGNDEGEEPPEPSPTRGKKGTSHKPSRRHRRDRERLRRL
jgi:hypothetical protein